MLLEPEMCYRAIRSHDSRFDGRFFVGVRSTGVYCRPICTVKAPKAENCTYFPSAAAAESMGYRPCLRCRPELAPGNASVDASNRIARSAASLIEDGIMSEAGIEAIASRLGVTDRHLRRVFHDQFGVSPVEFAQTQRLLLAKRLLTDTASSVTEVAFAAGFGSLRRFNALFKTRYRLSPMQLRKAPRRTDSPDVLRFELGFRPPYDWRALLEFLGARSINGVEMIEASFYRRTVRLMRGGMPHTGWIEVAPVKRKPVLRVAVSSSLIKVLPAVLSRVKHLMDLSSHPAEIADALGPLARANPGLRVPGAFDGFEIAVRAILGQQVSVAAARTMAGRFAAAFGSEIESPFASLNRVFPAAEEVASLTVDDIAGLGVIAARARSILEMARAITEGALVLAPEVDVAQTLTKLRALGGIGEWSAQYIAMRALAWPDAFPHTDLGLMKALGESDPKRVLAASDEWRPWRAYAAMHLWAAYRRNQSRMEETNGTAHRSGQFADWNNSSGVRRPGNTRVGL